MCGFERCGDFIWRRWGGMRGWADQSILFLRAGVYRRGHTGVLPMQGLPDRHGMQTRPSQAGARCRGCGIDFQAGPPCVCRGGGKGKAGSNRPHCRVRVRVCVDSLCFHVRHCWLGAEARWRGKKANTDGSNCTISTEFNGAFQSVRFAKVGGIQNVRWGRGGSSARLSRGARVCVCLNLQLGALAIRSLAN